MDTLTLDTETANDKENGMALSREEIHEKVKGVLVDALGVDEDEVTANATLREDLGAESIDFLDIVFRLEKAFTTDPAHPFKINSSPRTWTASAATRITSRTARSPRRAWAS
jgi:acyl carrier protein